MNEYFISVTLTAIAAFALGFIPLSVLSDLFVRRVRFQLVKTRKFESAQTFYLPYMTLPLMARVFDFGKGIVAVMLADLLLEKSDFSLMVAAVFVLMGSFFGSLLISRNKGALLGVWGILAYLSPVFSAVALPVAFFVSLAFNRTLAQTVLAVAYFLYCISGGYPYIIVLYPLLIIVVMAYLHNDRLRDLKSLFNHEWYAILPVRKG